MNLKDIKSKYFTWAENTSFHGIPHIFIAKKISVKLLWIVCILVSLCGGLILIKNNFNSFFKYEVRTIFSIDSKSDILFPTISICNLKTCRSRQDKCENSNEKMNNFLSECKFDGRNCTGSDFFGFYLDDYKKCYQFNGHHTKVVKSRAGKNFGLKLKLDFNASNCCELENIVLYVHNYPDWISNELNGYLINYDVETDVAIERTFYTKKPEPFSDCVLNSNSKSNSIHISRTFTYLKTYNQKVCMLLCFQEYLKNTLRCYDSDLPNIKNHNLSICMKFEYYNQVKSTLYYSKQNECWKNCPVECELQKYKVILSELKYPFDVFKKVNNMNFELKNLHINSYRSVLLNIFIKSDIYTKVEEQQAVSFSKLLSNIGSNMGLFLGISFLSLAELINLSVEILMVIINEKTKKKEITQQKT